MRRSTARVLLPSRELPALAPISANELKALLDDESSPRPALASNLPRLTCPAPSTSRSLRTVRFLGRARCWARPARPVLIAESPEQLSEAALRSARGRNRRRPRISEVRNRRLEAGWTTVGRDAGRFRCRIFSGVCRRIGRRCSARSPRAGMARWAHRRSSLVAARQLQSSPHPRSIGRARARAATAA